MQYVKTKPQGWRFDMFGTSVSFNLGNGHPEHRSCFGQALSILVRLVLLLFLAVQLQVMFERKDTRFVSSVIPGFQSTNFTVTQDDGFQVAFALFKDSLSSKDSVYSRKKINEIFEVEAYIF